LAWCTLLWWGFFFVWCNHLGPLLSEGWAKANEGSARTKTNIADILQSLIFIRPPPPRSLSIRIKRGGRNAPWKLEHFNCHLMVRIRIFMREPYSQPEMADKLLAQWNRSANRRRADLGVSVPLDQRG
jgi:hypothetical protein